MQHIRINGINLHPILVHLEDEIEDNNLNNEINVQPTYEESSKTLDVSVASILLSGAATIITTIFVEYFKKNLDRNLQNEITLTKKNKNGDEIKLTLKNLSFQDAELQMKSFISV